MVMPICIVAAVSVICATSVAAPVTPPAQLTPVRYELSVRLDFSAERLAGVARVSVKNVGSAPIDTVPFLLYRLISVTAARGDHGAMLQFVQDIVADADLPRLQANQVLVALTSPLPAGQQTTIELEYGGYLLGYAETGMRYVRDRIDPAFTILRDDAYAFPIVGYAARQAAREAPKANFDYVARITVPDSLVVANGGRLLDRSAANGEVTYTYGNILPAWRMDFVIGPYRALQIGPLRLFHLRRDSVGAARVADAARGALALFTDWFGPPPSKAGLTILEIEDGFGSQADETSILQAAGAFRDSTRLYEVYHELSHLWNPPDTDRPSSRWNEGLASFLEELATERLQHRPARDRRANQLMKWLSDRAANDARLRTVPLADYGKEGMAGMSYSVGMLIFDLLYRVMGEDEVLGLVRDYSSRYATQGAGLAELLTLARQRSGVNLTPLFHDWVATAAWSAIIRDAPSMAAVAQRYQTR